MGRQQQQPGQVWLVGDKTCMVTLSGNWWHPDLGDFKEVPHHKARPLVVIDPEDMAAVQRLSGLCEVWNDRVPYSDMAEEGDLTPVAAFQAALREFANPTPPKPEEPIGLGAVVEDADGVRYIRIVGRPATPEHRWQRHPDGSVWHWSAVEAVAVTLDGLATDA